jgi:hypothetical protein
MHGQAKYRQSEAGLEYDQYLVKASHADLARKPLFGDDAAQLGHFALGTRGSGRGTRTPILLSCLSHRLSMNIVHHYSNFRGQPYGTKVELDKQE